jgi:hypothetical protein
MSINTINISVTLEMCMGSKSVSSLWRFYLLGWHASGWDSRSYGSLAGSSQCGTPGPTNFGASHVMFLIFDDL